MAWDPGIDPSQIAEVKRHAPSMLPFMASAVAGAGAKLSFPRIIEAIIIAAISGGLTMWVTVSVINTELTHLKTSVNELKADIKELRRDVYSQSLSNRIINEGNVKSH